MVNALWITLIGMGLVFVAILLLWGLMALLVKLTEGRETPAAEEAAVEVEPVAVADATANDHKRKAAAAAVAIAMAMRSRTGSAHAASTQPSASVSAWQAVHRAGRLGQQMNASRKKVVR